MSVCRLVILAIVFGQPQAALPEPLAIEAAKKAIVRHIDPALPRVTFETWLRGLVAAKAVTQWEANDYGEQTGNPGLDQARDFPMCAQVRVSLSGKRELYLSMTVGTLRKGVTAAPPHFFSGYLTEPGGPPRWIKSLAEVPAVIRSGRRSRAVAGLPILDMHMHARTAAHYGATKLPMCAPVDRMPRWDQRRPFGEYDSSAALCRTPLVSPATDEEVLQQTIASMKRHQVIGVLGGEPRLVADWVAAAPGRFIAGLDLRFDHATAGARAATPAGAPLQPLSSDAVRTLHARGAFQVLAELMPQYAGLSPEDERLAPLWALAAELDIPVGIHVGGGGPGEPYAGSPHFRARLQSALTLEEVLIRHPTLRVYVMHGGYPMLDDLLALLFTYPQVYIELSMAANVETRPAFYRYLRAIVEAGYGDRVMFGSDQMVWPGLIDAAVRSIQEAPFLSARQKRDIFYNNAARFLRLTEAEIARHHALR